MLSDSSLLTTLSASGIHRAEQDEREAKSPLREKRK